jgi:chemotaxis protein MotA
MVITFGCVLGGYMAMGGHLEVLNQPFELVIIGGAGIGGFIVANPMKVVKETRARRSARPSRHKPCRRSVNYLDTFSACFIQPDAGPAHEVAQRDRSAYRQSGRRIADLPDRAESVLANKELTARSSATTCG